MDDAFTTNKTTTDQGVATASQDVTRTTQEEAMDVTGGSDDSSDDGEPSASAVPPVDSHSAMEVVDGGSAPVSASDVGNIFEKLMSPTGDQTADSLDPVKVLASPEDEQAILALSEKLVAEAGSGADKVADKTATTELGAMVDSLALDSSLASAPKVVGSSDSEDDVMEVDKSPEKKEPVVPDMGKTPVPKVEHARVSCVPKEPISVPPTKSASKDTKVKESSGRLSFPPRKDRLYLSRAAVIGKTCPMSLSDCGAYERLVVTGRVASMATKTPSVKAKSGNPGGARPRERQELVDLTSATKHEDLAAKLAKQSHKAAQSALEAKRDVCDLDRATFQALQEKLDKDHQDGKLSIMGFRLM